MGAFRTARREDPQKSHSRKCDAAECCTPPNVLEAGFGTIKTSRDSLITLSGTDFSRPSGLLLPLLKRHRNTRRTGRPSQYRFKGTVARGQTFSHNFDGFVFALIPSEHGWDIDISQGKQQHLANMTGRRHGVNATEIEVASGKVFAPRER